MKRATSIVREVKTYPLLAPPDVFGVRAYSLGKQVILLWGQAGAGKSTVAHWLVHRASITGPESLRATPESAGKSAEGRKVKGKPQKMKPQSGEIAFSGFSPLILLNEEERRHSYIHQVSGEPPTSCPFMQVVEGLTSGQIAELIREHCRNALKENRIPFVVIDSVANLFFSDDNTRGQRQKAITQVVDSFPVGYLILIAQVRDSQNPFRPYRPSVAVSNLHLIHMAVRMVPSRELRAEVQTVSMLPIRGEIYQPSESVAMPDPELLVEQINENKLHPLTGYKLPLIGGYVALETFSSR